MYWNKVKTVLIILFAAANIFFIYNLYSQYLTRNFILEDTIAETAALLKKSGIEIAAGAFPEKKLQEVIIGCDYNEDYYVKMLTRITGSENYTSYIKSGELGQGVKFTVKDTNDTIEFFGSFYLRYVKSGNEDNRETILSEYVAAVSGENYDGLCAVSAERMAEFGAVETRRRSELEKILAAIPLVATDNDITRAGLVITACAYDAETSRYLINCEEIANGCSVYDTSAFIIIENDEPVYISGNLIFFESSADYSANLYDQIDALFAEKAYIEENRTESVENAKYTISRVEVVYCVNWYSDRCAYYIVPAWKIVYSDGTVRVRSALNCSIYNI